MCLQAAVLLCYIVCITFHSFLLARNGKVWLGIKWFPVVPGLAALPLIFEQGGEPSIAKEIFSTLPNYFVHVLHTHICIKSVGVGDVSHISVLWMQKQSCCSPYSVWLETFLSCCYAPIHRKSPFSKKNSILSDVSCCQRAYNLLSTLPSKSNRILGRELPFPLETFSFQPERLSGTCFRLLCNTCCWWQYRSFSALWEERWLNRKANFIKEIWTT